jgi:hypothetical protein
MTWGWLTRVGRFLLDAVAAKAAQKVAEKVTRGDTDDGSPRCSFCDSPMVPVPTSRNGWACPRCASNPDLP